MREASNRGLTASYVKHVYSVSEIYVILLEVCCDDSLVVQKYALVSQQHDVVVKNGWKFKHDLTDVFKKYSEKEIFWSFVPKSSDSVSVCRNYHNRQSPNVTQLDSGHDYVKRHDATSASS